MNVELSEAITDCNHTLDMTITRSEARPSVRYMSTAILGSETIYDKERNARYGELWRNIT